mgnify:CR=1 FL=1
MLNIVDLPTPLGPSRPKICPWFNSKLIFSRMTLFLNDKEIFFNLIIGLLSLNSFIRNFFIKAINLYLLLLLEYHLT